MSTIGFASYRIEPYLSVGRANFLALPVVLVALGAAAASLTGPVDPVRTTLALIGLISLHVAVNAINEYSDYRRGIDLETDKTPFSGGSGTLPAGEIDAPAALQLGLGAAAVGALIGAYFLWVVGLVLLPLLAFGAVCVLFYTDFLARLGLGEVAAGLGLGSLPVIGVALVQDGQIGLPAYAAAVPAFFLTFNLLLLNEFPDIEPDRRGGRINLIHLFGQRRAALGYLMAGAAVPLSIVGAVVLGWLPGLALVGVVPSVFLARQVDWYLEDADALPVEALRDNVIWVLATNFVLAVGIALPAAAFATQTTVQMNDGAFLIGRMLFGLVLFFMAFNNLADLSNIADQIGAAGVPFPRVATIGASLPLLAAAVSIALGLYPTIGAGYLVVFMIATTVTVHNFLGIEDDTEQENQIFHFLKNLLILAAALVFLSVALGGADWAYGLGYRI
ncbi:MAG: UbiA family prenyltransferase [Halobacteriales archaeon]